ncbi:MAG: hypothetical protein LBT97_12495 [Planctomycetota bacterium]|nr:hypothetical protein [Planctomycetota bacterium]
MATASRKSLSAVSPFPAWYGIATLTAAAMLPIARLDLFGFSSADIFLTPGEWLLPPLGVFALVMGFFPHRPGPESVVPQWLAAIVPAALWLAAMLLGVFKNGAGANDHDLLAAWTARLVFPALAFLPLLAERTWRDRLFLALAAGVVANVFMATWQLYAARSGDGGSALRGVSGFLGSSEAYGLLLALFLPLLADWRGGERGSGNAIFMLLCMFLIPALSLASILSGGLLFSAFLGLLVAWAMWRGYAWIMGAFVCLLVFGYGGDARSNRDRERRRAITQSAGSTAFDGERSHLSAEYDRALAAFADKPFFGDGLGPYHRRETPRSGLTAVARASSPWYASLLGGSGIVGLGMWLALLAELVARAAGRGGGLLFGPGALGATVALLSAGVWTNVLAPGPGALVGVLLAFSALRDDRSIGAAASPAGTKTRNRARRPARPAGEKVRPSDGADASEDDGAPS